MPRLDVERHAGQHAAQRGLVESLLLALAHHLGRYLREVGAQLRHVVLRLGLQVQVAGLHAGLHVLTGTSHLQLEVLGHHALGGRGEDVAPQGCLHAVVGEAGVGVPLQLHVGRHDERLLRHAEALQVDAVHIGLECRVVARRAQGGLQLAARRHEGIVGREGGLHTAVAQRGVELEAA